MTATSRQDVTVLSARARTYLVAAGTVEPGGSRLADGTLAGRGDTIVTRHNNRKLATNHGRDWVRNGDLWHVQNRHRDGSLTVTNTTHHGTVVLPAGYVAEHVQLGYATTIHRAQGTTVDTSHTLIDTTNTRETTYVAMTRGRNANHAWVVADQPLDIEPERPPTPHGDANQVLSTVLARQSNEEAATSIAESERGAGHDRGALLGRYLDVLTQLAPPSDQLLRQALDQATAEAVLADPAWPALEQRIHYLAIHSNSPATLLKQATSKGPITGSDSPATVLHHRLPTVYQDKCRHRRDVATPNWSATPSSSTPNSPGARHAPPTTVGD